MAGQGQPNAQLIAEAVLDALCQVLKELGIVEAISGLARIEEIASRLQKQEEANQKLQKDLGEVLSICQRWRCAKPDISALAYRARQILDQKDTRKEG